MFARRPARRLPPLPTNKFKLQLGGAAAWWRKGLRSILNGTTERPELNGSGPTKQSAGPVCSTAVDTAGAVKNPDCRDEMKCRMDAMIPIRQLVR